MKKMSGECPSSQSGQHTWIIVHSEHGRSEVEVTYCQYCEKGK